MFSKGFIPCGSNCCPDLSTTKQYYFLTNQIIKGTNSVKFPDHHSS